MKNFSGKNKKINETELTFEETLTGRGFMLSGLIEFRLIFHQR
jgi:hypothetical protein